MGVTGGQPFGFDVGAKPGRGGAGIRGLDLGVRGMRVGGRRKLLVPPNLAYGDKVGWVFCVKGVQANAVPLFIAVHLL